MHLDCWMQQCTSRIVRRKEKNGYQSLPNQLKESNFNFKCNYLLHLFLSKRNPMGLDGILSFFFCVCVCVREKVKVSFIEMDETLPNIKQVPTSCGKGEAKTRLLWKTMFDSFHVLSWAKFLSNSLAFPHVVAITTESISAKRVAAGYNLALRSCGNHKNSTNRTHCKHQQNDVQLCQHPVRFVNLSHAAGGSWKPF